MLEVAGEVGQHIFTLSTKTPQEIKGEKLPV